MTERTDISAPATDVPLDEGRRTWDALAANIDAFVRRWESAAPPPPLAEFVPAGPPAVRRLTLVELVKVDLNQRHARGQPKRLEEYIAEFPELAGRSGVPCELVFEEYQARRRAGEAVDPREYFDRFPDRTEELSRLLLVHAPTEQTLSRRKHPEADVEVGERLDDFDLQALLGEGAFAKVFLAWQRSMQRRVALKVSADAGAEPQTLAQLDHPHVVRVFDQRQVDDRGLRLLYMAYLPGGTLLDVLKRLRAAPAEGRGGKLLLDSVDAALARRGEPVPVDSANRRRLAAMSWPQAVCHVGARLAEALDYAHGRGVLHRDVKPANVLLGADAAPQLADFNVGACSKIEGASPAAFFGGSIPYMSPEQIEAFDPSHPRGPESPDGRSDQYSLAVMLWELLAGRRPFPDERFAGDWGDTLKGLVARRRAGPDVASLPADTPPGLRDVLQTALQADPDRRFRDAGEMARELDLCLKPAARELVRPQPGWRTWVRRHPLPALYPAGVLPAALASWFSIAHNEREIVARLAGDMPGIGQRFDSLTLAVNAVLFPLGMLLFYLMFRPVVAGLRRAAAGLLTDAEARGRSLTMVPGAAAICLSGFVLGGFTFPIGLRLDLDGTLHFLAAQVLCGLIAFSYPLVGAGFLALRVVYPAFLPDAELPAEDVSRLRRLDRWLTAGLVLTALVPLLSVGLLAGFSSGFRAGMVALSAGGALGFGLAYWLVSAARADMAALLELRRPGG